MLRIEEYKSSSGRSYVEDAMSHWPPFAVQNLLASLKRLEEKGIGHALKIQLVEKIKGYKNLYEVRDSENGICYRVFFTLIGPVCWLVHAIRKKGRKAPLPDLRLADQRAKNIQ